jgi:hypothetical protein
MAGTKAAREAQKRRQSLQRTTLLHIETAPIQVRSLKKSARNMLKRERTRRIGYIAPWIRSPEFRYQARTYPSAHLLGLPNEILNDILFMSFGRKDVTTRGFKTHRLVRTRLTAAEAIAKAAGNLSSVCAAIRLKMPYIRCRWEEAYLSTPLRAPQASTIRGIQVPQPMPVRKFASKKKGKVVKVTQKKLSAKRRRRPVVCWKCCERHSWADPVCPLERRTASGWANATKILGKKHSEKAASLAFLGSRTVFSN